MVFRDSHPSISNSLNNSQGLLKMLNDDVESIEDLRRRRGIVIERIPWAVEGNDRDVMLRLSRMNILR